MEHDNSDPGDRKANKVGRDASSCKGKCEDLCSESFKEGRLY